MKKINVLSKKVAQLIAAGEVVERPASVLKELLENSIDAGATRITVEIKNGGVKLIKITDNGSGIYRDDVKSAFLRHATSKLHSAEDLGSISSLGFRGEALASVCAVSKLEIITKTSDEAEGTHYFINGGVPSKREAIGCSDGTVIFVRDLFYNVPARMKFLKKDVTESNACAGIIDRLALSSPDIAFKFIRDGKLVLNTPGNGEIKDAVYCVYGKDFVENMIKVDYELSGIKISGLVSKPIHSKPNKNMQHFFVNGRYVKSKLASSALDESFKNSIMIGKFPYCVIYIKIAPDLVDVNVHPTKTEVKFVNDKSVFEAIYYAVKSALMKGDENKIVNSFNRLSDSFGVNYFPQSIRNFANKSLDNIEVHKNESLIRRIISGKESIKKDIISENKQVSNFKTPKYDLQAYEDVLEELSREKVAPEENGKNLSFAPKNLETKNISILDASVEKEKSTTESIDVPEMSEKREKVSLESVDNSDTLEETGHSTADNAFENVFEKKINIIGEIFKCYIIIECENKMVLVDKHAAHERILFKKLKSGKNEGDSQFLLEPKVIQMEKNDYGAIIENLDLLYKVGFDIDNFGEGSVIVRSVPMYIEAQEISDAVLEIADYIVNNKKNIDSKKLDWLYHNIACRAAVKAGNKSSNEEIIALVKTLIKNPDVKYCPHGRPIFVEFSKKFIEKQFGRI